MAFSITLVKNKDQFTMSTLYWTVTFGVPKDISVYKKAVQSIADGLSRGVVYSYSLNIPGSINITVCPSDDVDPHPYMTFGAGIRYPLHTQEYRNELASVLTKYINICMDNRIYNSYINLIEADESFNKYLYGEYPIIKVSGASPQYMISITGYYGVTKHVTLCMDNLKYLLEQLKTKATSDSSREYMFDVTGVDGKHVVIDIYHWNISGLIQSINNILYPKVASTGTSTGDSRNSRNPSDSVITSTGTTAPTFIWSTTMSKQPSSNEDLDALGVPNDINDARMSFLRDSSLNYLVLNTFRTYGTNCKDYNEYLMTISQYSMRYIVRLAYYVINVRNN